MALPWGAVPSVNEVKSGQSPPPAKETACRGADGRRLARRRLTATAVRRTIARGARASVLSAGDVLRGLGVAMPEVGGAAGWQSHESARRCGRWSTPDRLRTAGEYRFRKVDTSTSAYFPTPLKTSRAAFSRMSQLFRETGRSCVTQHPPRIDRALLDCSFLSSCELWPDARC